MVSDLDIDNSNKGKLRKTFLKFDRGLFGRGFSKLKNCKPVHIKLKPVVVLYKGRHFNLPKACENVAKKEIQHMGNIKVLKELP